MQWLAAMSPAHEDSRLRLGMGNGLAVDSAVFTTAGRLVVKEVIQ